MESARAPGGDDRPRVPLDAGSAPAAAGRGRVRRLLPLLLFVLVTALVCGARAAASRKVGGDFLRYHRAGRLVATGRADLLYDAEFLREASVYGEERAAERREKGALADPLPEAEWKYAPTVAYLLAPLGALHPRTAWVLWGAWNGALVAVTFAAAWAFASRGAPWRWMLVPAVVLVRPVNDNLQLGQLNLSAIAPATVALWAFDRGRDRAAGLAAALGGVVKYYPAALALWFAWKRRFAAAAVCLVGFAAAFWFPALFAGPVRAADMNAAWLARRAHVYTEARAADVPGHSVKSFVYRVLGGTHYLTGSDRDRVVLDVSVAALSPGTLRWLVAGIVVALLQLALVPSWGPLRGGDDARGPPEASLFLCWILLASPEARAPHFLYLALPVAALTYVLVRAWREQWVCRRAATALAVVGAVLLQMESESLFGGAAHVASAWCVQGWATAAFGAALLVVLGEQRRRALPAAAG